MKQLVQELDTGKTLFLDLPQPAKREKHLVVKTTTSLISMGTERMLINFSKNNLFGKALSQPERVKQVLNKMLTDGVLETLDTVRSKLDTPIALGYSNVGVVEQELGTPFRLGDRVVSNGAHSEFVSVPQNLCAKIPENVDDECASFTVVGAIALNAIRLSNPQIGETFAVIGLGLIGQITAQLLRANGCKVICFDPSQTKCDLAESLGAQTVNISTDKNPVAEVTSLTSGLGVDGVIITASSAKNDIISNSAKMCRKKGRVILVGVVGLKLDRSDFYEKEITFQVSCSYGPGRYDTSYEDHGIDYPRSFVRWTVQRNFEAVLSLMSQGLLDVRPLISRKIDFQDALAAYETIDVDKDLGVILVYGATEDEGLIAPAAYDSPSSVKGKVVGLGQVGFLGAGGHSTKVLLPSIRKAGFQVDFLQSGNLVQAGHLAKKYSPMRVMSSIDDIIENESVRTVFIANRHNQHATQVLRCLERGKNVFVEKPLCISMDELDAIKEIIKSDKSGAYLAVGLNRRFSTHSKKLRETVANSQEPTACIITVNAGALDPDHWLLDPNIGGGRVIGEVCHFIDLARYIVGDTIVDWSSAPLDFSGTNNSLSGQSLSISLAFANGSSAVIHYLSNGSKSYPKERVELFHNGSILRINNFKTTEIFGSSFIRRHRTLRQDKGHLECIRSFFDVVTDKQNERISFEEIEEVHRVCLSVQQSILN